MKGLKLSFSFLVFRNQRCEEKAAATFEQECQKQIDTFYAKAEKDSHKIAGLDGESQRNFDSYVSILSFLIYFTLN